MMKQRCELIQSYIDYWSLMIIAFVIVGFSLVSFMAGYMDTGKYFLVVAVIAFTLSLIPSFKIGRLKRHLRILDRIDKAHTKYLINWALNHKRKPRKKKVRRSRR